MATKDRPGAIDLALSDKEREKFCALCRDEPGLTAKRIMELLKEHFGKEVGKAAAYTFMNGTYDEYIQELKDGKALADLVREHGSQDDGAQLATAANGVLSKQLFTYLVKHSGRELDLSDPDDQKKINVLTLAVSRLQLGEQRQVLLEAKVKELEAKQAQAKEALGDESLSLEEQGRKLKQLFGMAALLLAFLFINPMPSKKQNVDELRQKIEAAMQAPDTTRDMTDEELEARALANPAGNNVNGWVNPFPENNPFSLFKEYQLRYALDGSRFKAGLWGRQTGKDFTTEGEAVKDCLVRPGTTWMVAAPSERQSLDSLDKAKDWSKAFDLAISDYQEAREGSSGQTLLKSASIIYANGSSIVAVPGKPDTVRGKSANILLTEFDFFEDAAATWRAILPSITNPLRGGEKKVRLVTTPNGTGSAMHKLWTREDKKIKWARHLVTVYHAVLHGMPIDIEALREAFGEDLDGFAQECLCRFLDGSSVLLPYDLIGKCESAEASEHDTPEMLRASPHRKIAGIDFGRVSDPTMMTLGLRALARNVVRNITKLKGMSTPDQVRTLRPWLDLCDRICVDYTGPGIGFGDALVELYGEYNPEKHLFGKVELCTFTLPFKRDIFPALRMAFEKVATLIPVSTWFREDLHAVQQIITNGNYNYKAPRSDEGHSDGCTSLALMVRAGSGAVSRGATVIQGRGEGRSLMGSLARKFRSLGRGAIG